MADTDPGLEGPPVAVIGTGIMGSAMAANLVAAGLPTTVWDRSEAVVRALAERGARPADSPTAAVADVRVVITMLPTAAVVESVMIDQHALESFAEGAVWAQMGTIGVECTGALAALVAERPPDVVFVDAPVSGSKGPATAGQLLILASGPPEAADVLEPVFSAIGRTTAWVGPAGQGSRLKLVINSYLSMLVEAVAETLELAERMGVDAETLTRSIEGGPLDAPLADAKLHKMVRGDYSPEFPLERALKDVDLALDEAPGEWLPMLEALSTHWQSAVEAGHGREDLSVTRLQLGR